jgi:hypothetical protein
MHLIAEGRDPQQIGTGRAADIEHTRGRPRNMAREGFLRPFEFELCGSRRKPRRFVVRDRCRTCARRSRRVRTSAASVRERSSGSKRASMKYART